MKCLIILMVCLPVAATAQQINYRIEGTVDSQLPRSKVFLSYTDPLKKNNVDSTWTTDGHFTFSGTVTRPVAARVLIDPSGAGIYKVSPGFKRTLYLEDGLITIHSADSLTNAQVKGGGLNAENNLLLEILKPTRERMDALYLNRTGTPDENKAAKAAYDQAGLAFIRSHPSSPVSLDFLKTYGGINVEYGEAAPVFNLLSDSLRTTEEGKAYAKKLELIQYASKYTSIGSEAPDFAQADPSGKIIHLHDYKGKYVLIDFWASWCGPCRKENPNLLAAYRKYHVQGFNVLGVSLDRAEAKAAWLKAIKDDGLEWTQVSDLKYWDNAVARKYNIQFIPQNFLIGPDGKIVAKDLKGEALGLKLGEIFRDR